MARLFVKPSHLATAAAVLSASAEDGLTTQAPVSGAANRGSLRLRASSPGTPTAVTALDLALQAGGLPNGLFGQTLGVPGAALRWRETGDAADEWRGHTDCAYATYSRVIAVGAVGTDYPCASEPRALRNGSIGYARTLDSAGTDLLQFCHKATRTASWSIVSVPTVGYSPVPTVRPALVVLPSGRLLIFSHTADTVTVDAFYSDDHGATWGVWSTETRIVSGSSNATICAEVSGDSICVVTGGSERGAETLRVHWSLDGGQSFTQTATEAGTGIVRTCVTAAGQVLVAFNLTASATANLCPVLFGGGVGASMMVFTVRTARPQLALCTMDDGSIWGFANGYAADPLCQITHFVSIDNGATFSSLSNTAVIYNNGSTTIGPLSMVAGSWNGSIVLILVTDVTTATVENGQIELWAGGWDSLTETYRSSSEGLRGTNLYGALSYIADDIPNNLGWTKTDTGAGATITQTANGLNINSSVLTNSNYTINPGIFQTGDGFRMRFVARVNSGGSITSNVATVGASISDGADRQWWKLRFGTDQIRLVDQAGTIATSTLSANKFVGHTEVLIAWVHDSPSAGAGLISVWFRTAADEHWTNLATNETVAEVAGSATEEVNFGGPVAGVAVDWDVSFLTLAEGAGNLPAGFTNPDSLHGRPLSAAVDYHVKNGVHVGAFGGPGVQGDTYTAATTYQFAARNIWLAPRLPCRWQSGVDSTAANVVFRSSANTLRGNVVTAHGTNFPTATMEWASADSWGAPDYSVALSAVVWSGAVSSAEDGVITVDGAPWTPHRYRSETGRRWWLRVVVGPSTEVYEIDDNDDGVIYVDGLASAGMAGRSISIFGDRMGAVLPMTVAYPYMRLVIASSPTTDGTYRAGFVVFNTAHEVTTDRAYDNGFVDRWLPATRVSETVSGHTHVTVLGPEHHELRIAWGLQNRPSSDYLERVVNLFRSLRGDSLPVVFWRDTDDVSTLGLYRVQGPIVRENSYGELSNELARIAQLVLREETT